jgi:hypothetical protein
MFPAVKALFARISVAFCPAKSVLLSSSVDICEVAVLQKLTSLDYSIEQKPKNACYSSALELPVI